MKVTRLYILIIFLCFSGCSSNSKKKEQTPIPDFLEEIRLKRRQIAHLGTEISIRAQNKSDSVISKLAVIHQPTDKNNLTDWEKRFKTTPQNLKDYSESAPISPTSQRPYIYLGKLGPFTPAQNEIFQLTRLYLQVFYNCPVKSADSIPISRIPKRARRIKNGYKQLHSRYILEEVMKTHLPDSAANYLLLTASDLYPSPSWNFVFGQASLKDRVGVWSMYRFGDADSSRDAFNICLQRTLKVASHETGHMFSMKHCTFYHCVMQGAYHLKEADERPMYLCPVCLSKVNTTCKLNIEYRFKYLRNFWEKLGFEEESSEYQRFLNEIGF